jgi:hypothetical protein
LHAYPIIGIFCKYALWGIFHIYAIWRISLIYSLFEMFAFAMTMEVSGERIEIIGGGHSELRSMPLKLLSIVSDPA